MGDYSSGDEASLPGTSANLDHVYDGTDLANVGTNDTNYVNQTGSAGYELHQYKDSITAGNASVTWIGKSSLAPSSSKVQLQVYNVTGTAWEDVSGAGASNNVAAADTDFTLSGTIATADYLAAGVTTFRIYQAAAAGIQFGAELIDDWDMELDNTTNWTNYGSPSSVAKDTLDPYAGSRDLLISAANGDGVYQIFGAITKGEWYRVSAVCKRDSGTVTVCLFDWSVTWGQTPNNATPDSYTVYKSSTITPASFASGTILLLVPPAGGGTVHFDNISVKKITKSSLFTQQQNSGSALVTEASVAVTVPNPTTTTAAPAGVAICMDANDPTKYILGVVNRVLGSDYVQIWAVDGSTVATKSYEGGITYTAGYTVGLAKHVDDSVHIYYNGVEVGTGVTLAGYAGTIHGVFNSDDDNTVGTLTLTSP